MNLIIGGITIFGIGWAACALTNVPEPLIEMACLVAILGLLVLNNKRGKK